MHSSKIFMSRRSILACCTDCWAHASAESPTGRASTVQKYSICSDASTGPQPTTERVGAHMPLHRGTGGERGASTTERYARSGRCASPRSLNPRFRLLDPDPEVASLYLDVPALDDDGVLRAMLVSRRPQQFAKHIVRALRADGDGRVTLPRDSTLLDLLKNASWLPLRDDASGLAPRQVLVVPRELQSGIAPLATAGAVGEHRLPEEVEPAVWNAAETVVHEILGRPSRARQIQRLASALNPAKVAEVDGGAYLILPEAQRVNPRCLRTRSSLHSRARIRVGRSCAPPRTC